MMIAMVATFTLAWLPMNFINWTRDLGYNRLIPERLYQVIFAVIHLVAMSQVIWNPIIYSWFNKSFRKAVLTRANRARRKFATSHDGGRLNVNSTTGATFNAEMTVNKIKNYRTIT